MCSDSELNGNRSCLILKDIFKLRYISDQILDCIEHHFKEKQSNTSLENIPVS